MKMTCSSSRFHTAQNFRPIARTAVCLQVNGWPLQKELDLILAALAAEINLEVWKIQFSWSIYSNTRVLKSVHIPNSLRRNLISNPFRYKVLLQQASTGVSWLFGEIWTSCFLSQPPLPQPRFGRMSRCDQFYNLVTAKAAATWRAQESDGEGGKLVYVWIRGKRSNHIIENTVYHYHYVNSTLTRQECHGSSCDLQPLDHSVL